MYCINKCLEGTEEFENICDFLPDSLHIPNFSLNAESSSFDLMSHLFNFAHKYSKLVNHATDSIDQAEHLSQNADPHYLS